MSSAITFHQRRAGSQQQVEDRWRLVVNDDGSRYVEHEWSQHNPYTGREPNVGVKRFALDEFVSADHDRTAQARLVELLGKLEQG